MDDADKYDADNPFNKVMGAGGSSKEKGGGLLASLGVTKEETRTAAAKGIEDIDDLDDYDLEDCGEPQDKTDAAK